MIGREEDGLFPAVSADGELWEITTSGPISKPMRLAYSFASSRKYRFRRSGEPTKTILGFLTLMPDLSEVNFMAIFVRSRLVGLIEKI